MELSLLKDLLLVFSLAVAVLLICHQLHVAATVGFLFTGVLVGPQALGLIRSGKGVDFLKALNSSPSGPDFACSVSLKTPVTPSA